MENLKKLNETETRRVYGGKLYGKVCECSDWSKWREVRLIAAQNPIHILRRIWRFSIPHEKVVTSLFSK